MKKTNTNNGDFISTLSENLLVMIISLLPFIEAVRTSILAKRWQNLWRGTKNIDFDEHIFVERSNEEGYDESRRNFIVFAKNWCQGYPKHDIYGFRLVFSNPGNYLDDLAELVKFAIDHNVKALELDFSEPSWDKNSHQEPVFELPNFVYQHEGLESIKLNSCKVRFSEFSNPCRILNLSLGWTKLSCKVSCKEFSSFLAKCPHLEGVSLIKCWHTRGLSISAPKLKSLVIDKCLNLDGVDIDAENLNYFKYSGEIIYFTIENAKKLEVAEIDFGTADTFDENGDFLYNILDGLWSTKVLTVCSYLLQVIPRSEMRPNLECRHLILKTELNKYEYHGVTYMLNSCPWLESLTFDLGPARIFQDVNSDYFDFQYHPFLVGHMYAVYGPLFKCLKTLKTIIINGFKGEHYELKAIKYFISYGTALEKVQITLMKDNGVNGISMRSAYRLRAQSLMACPRASGALNFVIEN